MFDYNPIHEVSATDLQREPLMQTMRGKMEIRDINSLLQNAKIIIEPLEMLCNMGDSLLLSYLDENYIQNIKMEPIVPLPPRVNHPLIDLNISQDTMFVRVTLKQPPQGVTPVTINDVVNHLHANSIIFGIKTDLITSAVVTQNYGRSFLAACGKQAIKGNDEKIEFDYDINESIAPKPIGNGDFDYSSLSTYHYVKQGERICGISLQTCGTDGINVFGKRIIAEDGASINIECGNNAKLSDDGKSIIALCDGQVVIKDNKISITKVMLFKNIIEETGNVMFPGTVYVDGDIKCHGFMRVGGDIYVKGIINSGKILCNGDVVTAQGISGTGTGLSIEAKGCVRSKFIEYADIKTEKILYADSITQSNVECGDSLFLKGTYGCFVGGSCKLAADLVAKEIGNESGVETVISVDGLVALREEKIKCEYLIELYKKNIKRIREMAIAQAKGASTNMEKMKVVARLLYIERRLGKAVLYLEPRVVVLAELIEQTPPGRITVTDTMHQNVTLTINGASKHSPMGKDNFYAYKLRNNVIFHSNVTNAETEE